MKGEFIVFLTALNPIFSQKENGDNIKREIENLQNAILRAGLKDIEPLFIPSYRGEMDSKLMQEWLGYKMNTTMIHLPEHDVEPKILFTNTIISKVREHSLIICIYHNELWEIFQQLFPSAGKPKNKEILLVNLSEERILYCSS